MSDARLSILVGADVSGAISDIGKLDDTVASLEKQLAALGLAIDHALDTGKDSTGLEDEFQRITDKLKALRAQAGQPITVAATPAIPVPDDTGFLNSLTKQRIAFTDLGRVITGQGFSLRSLASNFALLGPGITIAVAALYGLYEILNKQTDAQKKAEEEAKKLHDTLLNLKSASDVTDTSTGSEQGNIARVQALAEAIQNTNNTYKERQNALNELRETNKAYFGDLTLEASSLATLSSRVKEYSQALITEAVVKGQVEEIAKVSAELEKQAHALDVLKDARDRAQTVVTAQGPAKSSAGNVAGGGEDVLSNKALDNLDAATVAYNKQRDAVLTLRTAIATYTGALEQNIALQIQQKPLTVPPGYKDDLKSIIPILQQIKTIYDEINKPDKEPLFKREANSTSVIDTELIQAQIREAIKKGATDGAKDPEVARAYADLATALQAKLAHLLNPDLNSHVQGIVDVTADDVSSVESKIEKAFGAKGLQIKVPIRLSDEFEDAGGFDAEDVKKIKDGLEKTPGLAKLFNIAIPSVQIDIGEFLIHEADLKKLKDLIKKLKTDVIESGFKDIGVALGDALSGSKNPLQAAIKDFTTVLGDGLIKIGEQMIIASTTMTVLKAALSNLFATPAGGVLAGIAAVALGEVVKNVGAHAFATGGIVTGPTLGLVGEAGPEVIFPLNQLNRFVKNSQGNTSQNIRVTGQLSGNNIRLALARTNKQQALV